MGRGSRHHRQDRLDGVGRHQGLVPSAVHTQSPAHSHGKLMELTHVDEQGRARMVDVSSKPDTRRVAVARGQVRMRGETLALIRQNALSKGDALATARIAGILAAKKTADLIPLCHPLMLTHVGVEFELGETEAEGIVEITATVETTGKTGVEMEALTAVSVAAL